MTSNYLQEGQKAIQAHNAKEAVYWFEKAVKKAPKDPLALANLGQSLCWLNQKKLGLDYLYKAGIVLQKKARKTRDTQQLLALAEQLQYWNDYKGALKLLKQTVLITSNLRCQQLLACTYLRLNKNKSALSASRKALELAPDNAVINLLQASLEIRTGTYTDAQHRLLKILDKPSSSEEKYRANKELALLLDKTKQYPDVFKYLHQAASLAPSVPEIKKQDENFIPELVKSYTKGFDKTLLNNCSNNTFTDNLPSPVFLIGFLRSGTTLAQEVLDTHPQVFISDESDLLVLVRKKLYDMSGKTTNLPEILKNTDQNTLTQLRQFYWDQAKKLYGDDITDKLFIDKTTMNTFGLGLINCIFPESKIIFVLRDPRDVCLSCYMQTMEPSPLSIHLTDWQKTATLYQLTMTWWLHIKEQMSLLYMEFKYEDAVANFEPTFQEIYNFIGLQWNSEANNFHKHASNKFIASPSYTQVTQPLYSSSTARWKNYEAEFDSVIKKLQPFIDTFGY